MSSAALKSFRLAKDLEGTTTKSKTKTQCSENDFVKHYSNHFSDRNLPMPPELDPENPFIPPNTFDAPLVDESEPTHGEVLKALSGFKNGKAKGTDDIHNEQLKSAVSSSAFVGIVLKLMLLLWNCPILPAKWLSCKISTLYEKESPLLAKNYRPVSMIATISKVLTKIVNFRVKERYEHVLSRDQFGFRSNSGTIDAIFSVNQLVKKKNSPVHAIFLVLRGAFDLVDRKQLFRVLEIQLESKKISNLIESYYTGTTGTIKGGNVVFDIGSGVRQGAEESPFCFNLFFDYVLAVVEDEVRREIGDAGVPFRYAMPLECNPRHLRRTGPGAGTGWMFKIAYADDLVFFDTDPERLRHVLRITNSVFKRFGLIIAKDKTKSILFNSLEPQPESIYDVDGEPLEHVNAFRYLGYNLNTKDADHFLNCQVGAAWSAFNKHKHALTD